MKAKQAAAEKAVTYVKEGMVVGLGTGSTAGFAIEALGKLVREGLSIRAVASSRQSEELAAAAGIRLASFAELQTIDLYIDGADEVDKDFNLVKGGGGALLREKILAFHSNAFLVIVDSSKLVEQLGAFPLPVEATPFAIDLTIRRIERIGCKRAIRRKNGTHFITDNGNMIIDCFFKRIADVNRLQMELKAIPGVVETGLFAQTMVSKVIVGNERGEVSIRDVRPST